MRPKATTLCTHIVTAAMTEPVRLSKRVAEITGCSRRDAELYVEGGWVRVNGEVIEQPQFKVTEENITIAQGAKPEPPEPVTMLFNKPAGIAFADGAQPALSLVTPESRDFDDPSGVRLLHRHFRGLTPLAPIEQEASGLMVLSQDGRVWRQLTEDAHDIEQEFVVDVEGELIPYGLTKLSKGLMYEGHILPFCKVSWQSERRLRFAVKGARPGQLAVMCEAIGLRALAIKRLRIGRISLSRMPVGTWRYLPASERF
jgi:23S rRNA pseudouridine2604 synthase